MNGKERICAGIVTYNPELSRLRENVGAIVRNGISHIVIADNASGNYDEIRRAFADADICFIANRENTGIAYALNQILETAERRFGSEWVLTLDQDSVAADELIDRYLPWSSEGITIRRPSP